MHGANSTQNKQTAHLLPDAVTPLLSFMHTKHSLAQCDASFWLQTEQSKSGGSLPWLPGLPWLLWLPYSSSDPGCDATSGVGIGVGLEGEGVGVGGVEAVVEVSVVVVEDAVVVVVEAVVVVDVPVVVVDEADVVVELTLVVVDVVVVGAGVGGGEELPEPGGELPEPPKPPNVPFLGMHAPVMTAVPSHSHPSCLVHWPLFVASEQAAAFVTMAVVEDDVEVVVSRQSR